MTSSRKFLEADLKKKKKHQKSFFFRFRYIQNRSYFGKQNVKNYDIFKNDIFYRK